MGLTAARLQGVITWLQFLGIPDHRTVDLLTRFPSILTYSVVANLQPKADFLKQALGWDDIIITKVDALL